MSVDLHILLQIRSAYILRISFDIASKRRRPLISALFSYHSESMLFLSALQMWFELFPSNLTPNISPSTELLPCAPGPATEFNITYVCVSPFGLANHATAQKTTMKIAPTRRDQLRRRMLAVQSRTGNVFSTEREEGAGVPVCHRGICCVVFVE